MLRTAPIPRTALPLFCIVLILASASAQVLEFWSNGLRYQALTRGGLTVMYARMDIAVRDYGVLQLALNNGSTDVWKVNPTDFVFEPSDGGAPVRGASEQEVIYDLYRNAGRAEVAKLTTAYERALYGNQHIRSSNGYEQRRLSALAFGARGIRAAAAASAIAFVSSDLYSGDSTDGAVFFPNEGRPLGEGRLVAVLNGHVFEFRPN